jgi:predicted nucleotide-binding protein
MTTPILAESGATLPQSSEAGMMPDRKMLEAAMPIPPGALASVPKNAPSPATTPRQLSKQVFVAYPYRLYPKDDYCKVYKEIERKYEMTFLFADEKITNMHIMKKIETLIRGSDFSIFDISGWNPNVTLELGFTMSIRDDWYIAIDPSRTDSHEVPSDLRGLDRIEYSSYTQLGTKITLLMEQWYPLRKPTSITEFIKERKSHVVDLLRQSPGLNMKAIADILGIDVSVTQLDLPPRTGRFSMRVLEGG